MQKLHYKKVKEEKQGFDMMKFKSVFLLVDAEFPCQLKI